MKKRDWSTKKSLPFPLRICILDTNIILFTTVPPMKYIMLTLVTKYSQIPEETVNLERHNVTNDKGRTPVEISPDWVEAVRTAVRKKENDLHFNILNMTILPDHMHININLEKSTEKIEDIVEKIIWYTSFMYNRSMQKTKAWKGKQITLRASWYALTHLETQEHLEESIAYVESHHEKHLEQWGEEILESYVCPTDRGAVVAC